MREIRRLWKASAKLKSNSFLVLDIELVFRKQIAVYMNSQRFFADHALLIVAKETLAHVWWSSCGAETP